MIIESLASPDGSAPLVPPAGRPPRVWKFIGTCLWGLFAFAAMFAGQFAVVGYFLIRDRASLDVETFKALLSSGVTIALSVVMGLPAVLGALWIATRAARMPFADYLALRVPSWKELAIGAAALLVLITGWDLLSRALGHETSPGFMVDVLKSAQADGALWLLVFAFCVAAPITEEFFARGFLYRGWSETFLRPVGAIVLSSAVWTAMHMQYNWFFLGQVFSIGLLLGYLRYRTNSTWLTVAVHGLNNLLATLQSLWLASQS
jgi:membrane protease YdiL (CAAX protease family)